jgi:hypothetical protein
VPLPFTIVLAVNPPPTDRVAEPTPESAACGMNWG